MTTTVVQRLSKIASNDFECYSELARDHKRNLRFAMYSPSLFLKRQLFNFGAGRGGGGCGGGTEDISSAFPPLNVIFLRIQVRNS